MTERSVLRVRRPAAACLATLGLLACDVTGPDPRDAAARIVAPLVAIAAAGGHTCAAGEDGRGYCWGDNASGQLGTGTATPSGVPVAVRTETRMVRFTLNGFVRWPEYGSPGAPHAAYSCALDHAGHAHCWGSWTQGLLGNGMSFCIHCSPDTRSPARVLGGPYAEVSAGRNQACAVERDGPTYCWGEGALVDFGWNRPDTLKAGGRRFRTVSAGGTHACALDATGQAFCWGRNRFGELGRPSTGLREVADTVVAVPNGLRFDAVFSGDSHTCALTADGSAYCWGRNDAGQLGTGNKDPLCHDGLNTLGCPDDPAGPRPVAGGLAFTTLAVGQLHTCGLAPGGYAFCWGRGIEGQLGRGVDESPHPVPVDTELRFESLAAGARNTCGVATDGRAYCWGWNGWGQLGTGTMTMAAMPVPVAGQE